MDTHFANSIVVLALPIGAALLARLSVAGVARWVDRHDQSGAGSVPVTAFTWDLGGARAFRSLRSVEEENKRFDVDTH